MNILSYKNDENLKKKIITHLKKGGRGEFLILEKEFGIPRWLICVLNRDFPLHDEIWVDKHPESKKILSLIEYIPVGVNMDKVKSIFVKFVLEETLETFNNHTYKVAADWINYVIENYDPSKEFVIQSYLGESMAIRLLRRMKESGLYRHDNPWVNAVLAAYEACHSTKPRALGGSLFIMVGWAINCHAYKPNHKEHKQMQLEKIRNKLIELTKEITEENK